MNKLLLIPFCALGILAQTPSAVPPAHPAPAKPFADVQRRILEIYPDIDPLCYLPTQVDGHPLIAVQNGDGYCKGVYQISPGNNFYMYDYY
jgi:hypothetical protein